MDEKPETGFTSEEESRLSAAIDALGDEGLAALLAEISDRPVERYPPSRTLTTATPT